ncbi:MAG TPA: DUF4199 domain-containing protein [Chryseosolibacter sp.]
METEINTTPGVTPRSAGIRFGLIAAVISVVYFLILSVAGLDRTSAVWSWLGYIITAAIIFLAHKYYKENGDGFMSYGQGVGISLWIGLISGVIGSIFTYLYIKFIDTGFIDMIKEKQLEKMQEKGMSDEQIDQAMKFASMFTSPEAILIFAFVGSIIAAVIIGLIVTIFTQKKNPQGVF